MVTLKRYSQSSLKVLMCLVLIFSFVFIKPKEDMEQAEAVVPIAGWAVSIIGGIIIDIAIDMGVKFVDKKAKEGFQNKLLQKIFSKNGNAIKINELKPTKTNAGKWALKVPKWLLALITGAITSEIAQTVTDDEERVEQRPGGNFNTSYEPSIDLKPTDPFYNTSLTIKSIQPYTTDIANKKYSAMFNSWFHYRMTPVSYAERTKLEISMNKDFSGAQVYYIKGGQEPFNLMVTYQSMYFVTDAQIGKNQASNVIGSASGSYWTNSTSTQTEMYTSAYKAFSVYLNELEVNHRKVYYSDGVLTGGYEGFLKFPDDISNVDLDKFDWSLLPPSIQNDRDYVFEIKDETILNNEQWTVIQEGDNFEWNIIEQDIINQGDTIYNITIIYDYIPIPNPDYQVTPDEQDKIDSNLPSTDGSKPPANVDELDGSLVAYVKNAYEYATNVIKTGVDGLKALGTGAVELTKLYGVFFSWLPKDIVVLMTSGLAIMLGLRIFRK